MALLPDNRFSNSTVEHGDIDYLREKGFLRDDVDVSMDRHDAGEFGQAYVHCDIIASTPLESRKTLQQRCREFARGRGFSLRVVSNSWRKDAKDSNAKYVCKKDQQQLVPGSLDRCPFYIIVHTGFHVDTFVESNLSDDATRQWQYDVSFATSHGVLEREMLPA
ncbi:hypothetical protein PC116_g634 [Phytophthora cactorum]|uniref:Uncharacterized protein n=1 Tax=Phytophthora cactorum TaxID=29920 RepID=A0A329RQT6_9STRA|nr:hypothetical protein PC112_g14833 [Phytophthora cactorum]KAG2849260.1 hypothetical protein PC111_g4 [Phytophthora cactorum]KAG2869441.1 hypothetical protein PC113_g249 [Phytophthora cactorum]KAG2923018.1 hypothetical protein PC117_g15834 [Phytophthora cactorum]KAG2936635.1 hypothetical protein PC114_g5 [Phytophthora cactorum]